MYYSFRSHSFPAFSHSSCLLFHFHVDIKKCVGYLCHPLPKRDTLRYVPTMSKLQQLKMQRHLPRRSHVGMDRFIPTWKIIILWVTSILPLHRGCVCNGGQMRLLKYLMSIPWKLRGIMTTLLKMAGWNHDIPTHSPPLLYPPRRRHCHRYMGIVLWDCTRIQHSEVSAVRYTNIN